MGQINQIQRLVKRQKKVRRVMTSRKDTKIKSIFRIIDTNLCKFYSSRPQIEVHPGMCQCKKMRNQKQEQIAFYCSQREMITRAAQILMQDNQSEEEQLVGKVLCLVTDYISKILELLNQEFVCACKANALAQSLELKHKIHFIRQENDKFFRLLQEKNVECQGLIQKLQQLKYSKVDIRPITGRYSKQNKQNEPQQTLEAPSLFDFSDQKSIKSSKISDTCQVTKVQAKETTQKTHKKYFNLDASKKQRKSKIFQQNQSGQYIKLSKKG